MICQECLLCVGHSGTSRRALKWYRTLSVLLSIAVTLCFCRYLTVVHDAVHCYCFYTFLLFTNALLTCEFLKLLLHVMFTFTLIDAPAYTSFRFVLSSDILDDSSSGSSNNGLSSDSLAKGSTTAQSPVALCIPSAHPGGWALTQLIYLFLTKCFNCCFLHKAFSEERGELWSIMRIKVSPFFFFFFFWHLSSLKFNFTNIVTLLVSLFADHILDLVTKPQILIFNCIECVYINTNIYIFLSGSKSPHFRVCMFKENPDRYFRQWFLFPAVVWQLELIRNSLAWEIFFCPLLTT